MSDRVIALSLFSGCGGLDIGSHLAGVPVYACLDFDKDSMETLKANEVFKDAKLFCEDIDNFSSAEYKKVLKNTPHDKFILLGGPPCQPFSKAGYWIGNDARKKDKDPRNGVSAYLKMVKELQPDGFLFENVESILHPTNKHVVEEIERSVKKMGYNYVILRVNAADYGVPQKRKRIFILGSKKKITGRPEPTHAAKDLAAKLGLRPHVGVGTAIAQYAGREYQEPEEIANHGTFYADLVAVPAGKNYIALTKPPLGPHPTFVSGKRFWSFLLKLTPDEPSWTIAAQPGPWVGPFHWTSRRLRVPEIAAIQTFPPDYVFMGSRRSIQKQIGNAVPPLLGQQMVAFLRNNI